MKNEIKWPIDYIRETAKEIMGIKGSHKKTIYIDSNEETALSDQSLERLLGKAGYDFRLSVEPADSHFCAFTIAFGMHGTYDVHWGHGLHVDEIPLTETPPRAVASAIINGAVKETIWTIGTRVIQARGKIEISANRTLHDRSINIFSFFSKPREVSYSKY